jgi:RND family efflux transporter MFP subunit
MFSPWTRDARVHADVVSIAPDVSGFLRDLRVKDNQFVHKGDVLLVLDQDRYKLAVATAEANVAARRAEMEMRQHVADRRAHLTNLSTSVEERENAAFTANAAVAAYAQAVADLATARLNLDRTVVYAPVNGFITNLTLDVGQYAAVGAKLLAVIDSDSYRVEGYFEETKIPRVRPDQPVKIFLMSGDPPLSGRVESISRGITDRDNNSGPELLANVTPTFEWVRLAQRIPVRIRIETIPDDVRISSGMTCTVVVDMGPRPRSLASLAGDVGLALGARSPM